MKDNIFVTETDAEYVRIQSNKSFAITFLFLSLVACLGFFITWQTFIFFEMIVLISCIVGICSTRKNGHYWRFEFNDDLLLITNLKTQEKFSVYDIPSSDFIINQSKNEKKKDYCSFLIKNTSFAFGGVKDCHKLKQYIQDNYK